MASRAARYLCLLLISTACATVAWSSGPFGGTVKQIVTDSAGKNPVLAATDRGLFRWKNEKWKRLKAMGQTPLVDVAVIDKRIVALANNDGVWLSDDGGSKWRRSYLGLVDRYGQDVRDVTRLCKDPTNRRRLYLGSAGQGFFVSRDQGHSWSRETEGLDELSAAANYISAMLPPLKQRPMIIATGGEGLFIRDGKQWERLGEGLPPGLHITDLAEAPDDPNHLAMGTTEEGLWESHDGGKSWAQVWKGRYGVVSAVTIAANGDLHAFFPNLGLMHTREGRPLGRAQDLGFSSVNRLIPLARAGWYAAMGNDGIYPLDEEGNVTGTLNEGLSATVVNALAVGPATEGKPGGLWCGDRNGAFEKPAGATVWMPRDEGLLGAPATALVRKGDALFLGVGGLGVFLWDPEAKSWINRGRTMGMANTVNSLVLDGERALLAGTEGGVLRTEDEGLTWKKMEGEPFDNGLFRVAAHPETVGLYWVSGKRGLFRTEDGGESWTRIGDGLANSIVYDNEALWVLRQQKLERIVGDETTLWFESAQDDRVNCVLPTPEGTWVGTLKGLWLVEKGQPRPIWKKAGILALLLGDDGRLHAGTDGRGVLSFRLE